MALLAVAVAGCGGGNENKGAAQNGTYVGKVKGTNAYVALVSDIKTIAGGYVCDGKKVSTWFGKASVTDSKTKLASRQGAALGEATLSGDHASGQVSIAGQRHAFSARLASGKAGLYRKANADPGEPGFNKPGFRETGWIVLPNGSLRGDTNLIGSNSLLVIQPAPSSPKGTPVTAARLWTERERYR